MPISANQIATAAALVITSSTLCIACRYLRTPAWKRPFAFMTPSGSVFLALLMWTSILLFAGGAVYLGLANWVLCAILAPIAFFILGPMLSPVVFHLVVRPLLWVYNLFAADQKET